MLGSTTVTEGLSKASPTFKAKDRPHTVRSLSTPLESNRTQSLPTPATKPRKHYSACCAAGAATATAAITCTAALATAAATPPQCRPLQPLLQYVHAGLQVLRARRFGQPLQAIQHAYQRLGDLHVHVRAWHDGRV